MKTNLYLKKSSYLEVTREPDPYDDWDRGNTLTEWSFGELSTSECDNLWYERFPVDFDVKVGDILHVVVAVWSTGDSFGNDIGRCSEVFGIFRERSEAIRFKEKLENGEVEYVPWNGYFESLDYISVLERVLE